MIIGITGKHCAGKDTAAQLLEEEGFAHYSLSDILREELLAEGRETTRNNLINKGNALRKQHGPAILAERTIQKLHNKDYVITSFRNPAEVDAFRNYGSFVLLAIDAPLELRFKRLKARQSPTDDSAIRTLPDLEAVEQRESSSNPDEIQLPRVIAMADHVIPNDRDKNALKQRLRGFLDRCRKLQK